MTSRKPASVLVVGAGLVGLSSALVLQERCHVEVTIWADQFSPHTTSDVSGGYWTPFQTEDTDPIIIRRLGQITQDYLLELAYSPEAKESGAQISSGYKLFDSEGQDPLYRDDVPNFRWLTKAELDKFPGVKSAFFHSTAQLDVTRYLGWLMKKFKENHGKVECRKVSSLKELIGRFDVVVNCTGFGAYDVIGDKQMIPVRGQIMRVYAPWIKHFYFFMGKKGASYLFPSMDYVVVGGTTQRGDMDKTVREADSQDIWTRACTVFPFLKGARIITELADIRPVRKTMRLEAETLMDRGSKLHIIHNYGHGGAGATLHWGCALEVARMTSEALRQATVLSRL